MRRWALRGWWGWAAPLLVALVEGCGGRGDDPSAQFEAVVDALRAGSLADAYAASLPRSYDADLNELLVKVRGALDDTELGRLRDLVGEAGRRLGPELSRRAGSREGALTLIAERLSRLPTLLGLDDLVAFRALDVKGILSRVDAGLFRDLTGTEEVRARLAGVRVRTVERERDWARLLFTSRDLEGREAEERVEVIRVDGRWVPKAWVVDWPRFVSDARRQVDAVAALRKERPEAIRESIESASALLADPAALLDDILGRFGGGAEREAARVRKE